MKPYENDLKIAKNLLGILFGEKLGDVWYERSVLHEDEDLYEMIDRKFGFDLPENVVITTEGWRSINRSCADYFGINRWDDSTAGKAYIDYTIGYRPETPYSVSSYYFEIQHRMDI
jgi:hypothetical protein